MANEIKPSIFDDLEERPGMEAKPLEPKPLSDEAKELQAALEKERTARIAAEEKAEKQSNARREARRETKELKKQIEAKSAVKTEEKAASKEPDTEEDDEEIPVAPVTAQGIDVEGAINKKFYEQGIIQAIKGRARYRDEAEILKATVDRLVAGGMSSGDPEEDVESASALLAARNKRSSGEVPTPSSVGGVPVPSKETVNGIPKSAIQMGKTLFGMKDEDYKSNGEIRL